MSASAGAGAPRRRGARTIGGDAHSLPPAGGKARRGGGSRGEVKGSRRAISSHMGIDSIFDTHITGTLPPIEIHPPC